MWHDDFRYLDRKCVMYYYRRRYRRRIDDLDRMKQSSPSTMRCNLCENTLPKKNAACHVYAKYVFTRDLF
jgi:hypothetical protein